MGERTAGPLEDHLARADPYLVPTVPHRRPPVTDQLTTAETELAELAITRKTLISLTGHTDPATPADATVASPAYQQILAVFHATTEPMRAKDICRALGTGTTVKDTENLRAKLKRLVARHILTEPEAGMFTIAPPTPSA